MRVLFVSSGNIGGGRPTNLIYAQGESIKAENAEVEYFTILGKGLLGYLKNVKRLKNELKKKKYDVIHAHYGFCGIVGYLAKTEQKTVVSLMGSDLLGKEGSSIAERVLNRVIIFVTKIFSKYLIDHTIVKSTKLASELFSNTPYSVIPNGVNFSVFYPIPREEARQKLGITSNHKIILFATDSSRYEKNYDLAKAAVDKLEDKTIELKVIHGVSQEQLNLYYNASDIVLLTSLYEGSPNVIKEALACNKVIVSTDVGDVRKNFEGVAGCYLTTFEAGDVAKKLSLALNAKSSNGRECIAHLDSKLVAKRIIETYNGILK